MCHNWGFVAQGIPSVCLASSLRIRCGMGAMLVLCGLRCKHHSWVIVQVLMVMTMDITSCSPLVPLTASITFNVAVAFIALQARAASTTNAGYPPHTIYKWSSKFTSMVHSTIMSLIGVAAMALEDWESKSRAHGRSLWIFIGVGWEIGYLFTDLGLMAYEKLKHNRWAGLCIVLHHVGFISVLPMYYKCQCMNYYIGVLFTINLSTAFWQLRYILVKWGKEASWICRWTTYGFLLAYLVCRFLSFPFMFWKYADDGKFSWYELPYELPAKCLIGTALVMCFNLYWFSYLLHSLLVVKKVKLL